MSASSRPTLRPLAAKRQREVDGDRRFADAALAGGDRDDGAARRAPAALPPAPARRLCVRVRVRLRARAAGARAGLRLGGQHRRDREHAGERLDRALGRLAQRLELAAPRCAVDLDREADMAVAQLHARDHAEAHDVLAAVGIDDLARARPGLRSRVTALMRACPLVLDILAPSRSSR